MKYKISGTEKGKEMSENKGNNKYEQEKCICTLPYYLLYPLA